MHRSAQQRVLQRAAALALEAAASEGAVFTSEAGETLAEHAHGTPRETLRLVACVLDDVEHYDGVPVGQPAVLRALEALGYDREGLDPDEQRYMALLRASSEPISLARLARMLGQSVRAVDRNIEPYLCARGLVRVTQRGREAGQDRRDGTLRACVICP